MYRTKSSRANALNQMVSNGLLTPEGKRWLIEALDPFHDEQLTTTGFPDMNVADSIVQCIKKTQTIKKSPDLEPGANWDVNIVLWPLPQQDHPDQTEYSPSTYSTNLSASNASLQTNETAAGVKTFPIGGITAYQADSGEATFGNPGDGTQGHVDSKTCTLDLPTKYLAGSSRVIAMGMEVVNTTSELHLQGQVLVYRVPMPQPNNLYTAWVFTIDSSLIIAWLLSKGEKLDEDADGHVVLKPSHWAKWKAHLAQAKAEEVDVSTKRKSGHLPAPTFVDTLGNNGYMSVWGAPMPPGTLDQATLLAGSQQWEAKKGCYCVATLNTLDNPAKVQMPQVAAFFQKPIDATQGGSAPTGQNGVGTGLGTLVGDVGPTAGKLQPSMQFIAPFNVAGAYFTGLSPETTLSVSVNYYVERFPDPQEEDLVVLASPSPGHDALAMDIYAKAMRLMPVGVQQNENPFGEWFQNVVYQVAKVAGPALKMVPNPVIAGIGTIAEDLAEALKPAPPKKKSKKARNGKTAAAATPNKTPALKSTGASGAGKGGRKGRRTKAEAKKKLEELMEELR